MIRPMRALRTSVLLSAATLACLPAHATTRDQRAQSQAIPAAAPRTEPDRTSYFNAIQQYAYTDGALFQIYTAPGQITDIMLQEGEELVGPGPVASGDTVRWII